MEKKNAQKCLFLFSSHKIPEGILFKKNYVDKKQNCQHLVNVDC